MHTIIFCVVCSFTEKDRERKRIQRWKIFTVEWKKTQEQVEQSHQGKIFLFFSSSFFQSFNMMTNNNNNNNDAFRIIIIIIQESSIASDCIEMSEWMFCILIIVMSEGTYYGYVLYLGRFFFLQQKVKNPFSIFQVLFETIQSLLFLYIIFV